jgi:hypothetical protein
MLDRKVNMPANADESRRKRLIAYCPSIELILDTHGTYGRLDQVERDAIVAHILTARIISKGEWYKFLRFAEKSYKHLLETKHDRGCHCTYCHDYMAWLISDPAHFAEVVGEAIEQVLKIEGGRNNGERG